ASEPRYMYQFSQRLASDKYHTSGSSYGWTRAAYAAMQEAIAYAGDIRIPLLILQAENDHLVLPGGQRQVAQRARNAAIMKIPGSKHEIFNATTEARELYWQVIFTFLETPVSEIPAAG
ncbi:MAG: alpha/beta hydrolase, partial [Solobacterium sp.]|nr:alpha/beta hydrolase [Solobacterium sp.]